MPELTQHQHTLGGRLTLLVVPIPHGDRVVTERHRERVEQVGAHARELGRADESAFVCVHVDTAAVDQQEVSETRQQY